MSNGNGNVFLWLFCAMTFLKTAQKFDSYLAAMGLNVAQTSSGMGMELLKYVLSKKSVKPQSSFT